MGEFVFGSLREKICKSDEGLVVSSLAEWLEYIFPDCEIVYDKPIPKDIWLSRSQNELGSRYRAFRPDARIESRNLIVEFDGTAHYTNASIILGDIDRDIILGESLGYNVVRIPFYVQLSKEVIKHYFDVDVPKGCSIPSGFFSTNKNDPLALNNCTPACFCTIGINKLYHDLMYDLPENTADEIMLCLNFLATHHPSEAVFPIDPKVSHFPLFCRGLLEVGRYGAAKFSRERNMLYEYVGLANNAFGKQLVDEYIRIKRDIDDVKSKLHPDNSWIEYSLSEFDEDVDPKDLIDPGLQGEQAEIANKKLHYLESYLSDLDAQLTSMGVDTKILW